MGRLFRFFSSIRLTVVLLFSATYLVWISTLDQVRLGIHGILDAYYKSFFHWFDWPEEGLFFPGPAWLGLPVPGGYLIGTLLLINLALGHLRYSRFSLKKIGIVFIHLGVVLLIVGQFITDHMQKEYDMVIDEGGSSNFLARSQEGIEETELVIIDVSDPEIDKVTAVPGTLLREGMRIERPELPFEVVVHRVFPNTEFGQVEGPTDTSFTVGAGRPGGLGRQTLTLEKKAETAAMDQVNLVSADIELIASGESLARLAVSMLPSKLFRNQTVTVDGRTFLLDVRLARRYLDYRIHLANFSFDRYPKSDEPFNYSSDVRLENPKTGEVRELRIWMNHPLRYDNLTFFQSSFASGERTTVLHVVDNLGKWVPYIAFLTLSIGLLLQFTISLVAHVLKTRRRAKAAMKASPAPAPALTEAS